MKERQWSGQFGKWAKANIHESTVFELKVCGTSLPFSNVAEHQMQGLLHAKHDKLYLKIPDCGYSAPFDAFMLSNISAYIVIRYTSGNFYLVDIDIFLQEKKTSIRKSLTEQRCKEIYYLQK